MNEFRLDHMYILYYVNVAHLITTGIFPVGSLIVLNYLVYSHLVERRRQAESLGRPKSYMIFHTKILRILLLYLYFIQIQLLHFMFQRHPNTISSFSTANAESNNVRKPSGAYVIWSSDIVLCWVCVTVRT